MTHEMKGELLQRQKKVIWVALIDKNTKMETSYSRYYNENESSNR